MTKPAEPNGHLVSIHLSEAEIALIDRAARARGLSRADFLRDAALRAADDVLLEQRQVPMSVDGFARFTEQLAQPARVIPALVDVLKRRAPWDPPSNEGH